MDAARPSTIRDVAIAAGVSPTSVSRHLSKQIVLPTATAQRIDLAVKQLGYLPNALARRLTRGSSETLGFVTTDIAYPFFAAVASAAEFEAARRGYSMAIFNSRNEVARELQFLSRIEDRQVDGILFMTNHPDDGTLRVKINRCRHVVLLDEDIADADVPKLFAENQKGAWLATRHLIEAGHSRIAFLSGPADMLSGRERFAGFEQAMKEAGLGVDPRLVISGPYSEQLGVEAVAELSSLADPPTAVFAAADQLAIGVVRGARARGLAIPHDLSIVGFDDILHSSLFDPPLTTVRQSTTEFGRLGVRELIRRLSGRAPRRRTVRLPVELAVRGSVAPPRRGRPLRAGTRRRAVRVAAGV